MGRPKGQKNKAKVCYITLADLNNHLQPQALIPVDTEFVRVLLSAVNGVPDAPKASEVEIEVKPNIRIIE